MELRLSSTFFVAWAVAFFAGLPAHAMRPDAALLISDLEWQRLTETDAVLKPAGEYFAPQSGKRAQMLCGYLDLPCLGLLMADFPGLVVFEKVATLPGVPAFEGVNHVIRRTIDFYSQRTIKSFDETLDPSMSNPVIRALKAKSYLNISKKQQDDEAGLEALVDNLKRGRIAPSDFKRQVLRYSRGFTRLSDLYDSNRGNVFGRIIHEALTGALLVTLDTLTKLGVNGYRFYDGKSESSRGSNWDVIYPYNDNINPNGSLLDLENLYLFLKPIGRWPIFRELTPEVRENSKGEINMPGTFSKWKVKGFYSEYENAIWLDDSNDFYENLYILYHELSHVAFVHSQYKPLEMGRIINLLAGTDDRALEERLLSYISEIELMGFDQQIRLFHGVGHYTEQWARSQAVADGWAKSMFSDLSNFVYMVSWLEIKSRQMNFESRIKNPIFQLAGTVADALIGIVDMPRAMLASAAQKLYYDDHYKTIVRGSHEKIFNRLYLKLQARRHLDYLWVDASALRYQKPGYYPYLCQAEKQRLEQTLKPYWGYGIPFPYSTENGFADGNYFPGGEGVHPGGEGVHPELIHFPSMESEEMPSRKKGGR